jgi:hypothetical protein
MTTKTKKPRKKTKAKADEQSLCVCGAPATTVLLYVLPVCGKCHHNDINWGVRPTTLKRVKDKMEK